MNKRQRKKRHRGEFQELGFEVRAKVRGTMSPDEFDTFVDLLVVAVEARQLVCGGGGTVASGYSVFVTRYRRGSTTEDDRTAVTAFLTGKPEVAEFQVGPLIDAWYG